MNDNRKIRGLMGRLLLMQARLLHKTARALSRRGRPFRGVLEAADTLRDAVNGRSRRPAPAKRRSMAVDDGRRLFDHVRERLASGLVSGGDLALAPDDPALRADYFRGLVQKYVAGTSALGELQHLVQSDRHAGGPSPVVHAHVDMIQRELVEVGLKVDDLVVLRDLVKGLHQLDHARVNADEDDD